MATDEAYIDFLKSKLVEWYAAAQLKSDCHAPAQQENDREVFEAGEKEGAGMRGVLAECPRCLQWINKPLQPDFKEDRQT